MKLRMLGDSLRLRLTMSETQSIGEGQSVAETTSFPDGSVMAYVLSVAGEQVSAGMAMHQGQHQLLIKIPLSLAEHWSHSTDVGLGGDEPLYIDGLQILIEKDFDCVSPRLGDEGRDTFPNPSHSDC
ncbi:MAG: hypothetical protein ACI883_001240 [Candidatus Azotimanducaceae bacterium]|jgi:hypothetical protein|tara:strand:- start:9749 stop:10129 length:381 start_codon:yes stop_codon:yes gene_type:complete